MIKTANGFVVLWRQHRTKLVKITVICILTVATHTILEFLEEEDNPGFKRSIATVTGAYQQIVTAPRTPVVRFVKVVEIDSAKDIPTVSDLDVCNERVFMAHLLKRISDAKPAMIVVDKFFGRNTCDDDDGMGTFALMETVKTLRESHPVVVGLNTTPRSDGRHGSFIEPTLPFEPEDQFLQEGIINVPHDNRRLPLQWLVYLHEDDDPAQRRPVDTLALTTAKLYEPYLFEKNPKLAHLVLSGEQPFIGFVEPMQFKRWDHFYASEVLCGRRTTKDENWKTCKGGHSTISDLHSRIVLIGESNPDRDKHRSVVGQVTGVYLQANYIEALLDDRYYRPVGQGWDYMASLVFVILIELILSSSNTRIAFIKLNLLVFVSYFVLKEITMHQSIYIDPWPTLIAVFFQIAIYLSLSVHRFLEAHSPLLKG
jgi:CHASE2 domain-containing sensor protein